MSTHRVDITIKAGDYHPTLKFSCTAPVGATCRLQCAENCGAESYPCYSYDDTDNEREHPLIDAGECNILSWLEDDPWESYHGPERAIPLASGPVEVEWEGDSYSWRFADEAEQVSAA